MLNLQYAGLQTSSRIGSLCCAGIKFKTVPRSVAAFWGVIKSRVEPTISLTLKLSAQDGEAYFLNKSKEEDFHITPAFPSLGSTSVWQLELVVFFFYCSVLVMVQWGNNIQCTVIHGTPFISKTCYILYSVLSLRAKTNVSFNVIEAHTVLHVLFIMRIYSTFSRFIVMTLNNYDVIM